MNRKLCRIAYDVAGDMIASREDFRRYAEDELADELDYLGDVNGLDAYNAETNGNDDFYQMFIYADDEYVRYNDESYSELYYDNGDEWSLECDGSHLYPYEKFPFSKKEFKDWLGRRVKEGIAEGRKALAERPQQFKG